MTSLAPPEHPEQGSGSPPPISLRGKLVAILIVVVIWIAIDFTIGLVAYLAGDYDELEDHGGDRSGMRVSNETYHHGLRPATRGQDHWGPIGYELVTNSLALKDGSERDVPARHEGRRILFIGDSFTEGVGVPYEQTWVGLIAARLASSGVDVLNAGVVSYSPKLEYYKVRDLLERVGLEIDELVVFIDISDTPDEMIYNDFVPDDLDPRDTWTGRFEITAARPMPHEFLFSYRTVSRWLGRDPWSQVRYIDRTTGSSFDFINARNEWAGSPRLRSAWGDLGLESAAFYMDLLIELCANHGVEIAIGVNPWPDDIRGPGLQSAYREFWVEYAARRGVRLDDLYPAFIPEDPTERQKILETEFLADDIHVNEAGHRRFAEAWLELRGND